MDQKNKNIFQGEIDRIKNEMAKEPGFSRLPEEKQKILTGKMKEAVLKRIFLEIFEKLNQADGERLRGLIENESSPAEMNAFFGSRIAGYEEMIKKIADGFLEEMKKEI